MINHIEVPIPELKIMSKYPKDLFYIGNLELLKRKKIGVIGSRNPSQYSANMTQKIVSLLSQSGNVIVSGGAIGIDTIAHKSAGFNNTIMVSGTGLDIRYPAINKKMIYDIEQQGLVLSQFRQNTPSLPRNFAIRNEIIVALSDILIVAYADLKSGSMRSIEYAIKMNKDIYVLPHRIGESEGTNQLLAKGKAKAIYDIDAFVSQFGSIQKDEVKDDFLDYCKTNPAYNEAVFKYSDKVFEYELLGKIEIKDGKVVVK
ncbi:DNA-processing protein DprA [Aliarcobacter vitoriensis]|uniref:DNA processing protein DprA n=1 Tax=Aliarcobacter vitoriensis TaxID=2011099 RepID=A0A366MX84_9BACT|nr:DNA-processing protein DprA [Aliarcobacter vitoriensis]RBQ30214.1 DNA processing protein DprA [Aliarcobacter vitoriensis]